MRRDRADVGSDQAGFHRRAVQFRHACHRPAGLLVECRNAAVSGPQQGPGAAGQVGQRPVGEQRAVGPSCLRHVGPAHGQAREQFGRRRLGIESRRLLPVVAEQREQFRPDIDMQAEPCGFDLLDSPDQRRQRFAGRPRAGIARHLQDLDGGVEYRAPVFRLYPPPDRNLLRRQRQFPAGEIQRRDLNDFLPVQPLLRKQRIQPEHHHRPQARQERPLADAPGYRLLRRFRESRFETLRGLIDEHGDFPGDPLRLLLRQRRRRQQGGQIAHRSLQETAGGPAADSPGRGALRTRIGHGLVQRITDAGSVLQRRGCRIQRVRPIQVGDMHGCGRPDLQAAQLQAGAKPCGGVPVGVRSIEGAFDGDRGRIAVQNQNIRALARIAAPGEHPRLLDEDEARSRAPARRRIPQRRAQRQIELLLYGTAAVGHAPLLPAAPWAASNSRRHAAKRPCSIAVRISAISAW